MNNYIKAVIAIVPFTILYFGLVFYFEAEKNNGKEFVLQVVSRDPNDLLRGEYVNLQYDINRIEDVQLEEMYTNGEYCVELSTTVPAKAVGVSVKGEGNNGNLICGDGYVRKSFDRNGRSVRQIDEVNYVFNKNIIDEVKMNEVREQVGGNLFDETRKALVMQNIQRYLAEGVIVIEPEKKEINLTFSNIQKYFLPRGTGGYIDKMARENKLQVVIFLAPSGRAYIKYLQVDGKKVGYNNLPKLY